MATKIVLMLLLCVVFFASSIEKIVAHNNTKNSIPPFITIFDNGTIVRDNNSIPTTYVPPQSTPDVATGVVSKDITLGPNTNLSARAYLPSLKNSSEKLPILVYFHGGAFCIGSPFSGSDHAYLNRLTSQGRVVTISINYRLFPEHALPTAFHDAWLALQWVLSQSRQTVGSMEPWLASHGDFSKVFLGGESAGATIVHNVAMRASADPLPHDLHIFGAILITPYFLGSSQGTLDPVGYTSTPFYRVWSYVCPQCPHGVDNSAINPVGPWSPTLKGLAVKKVVVYNAELDPLLGSSIRYVNGIRESRWEGILTSYEAKNVSHVFHMSIPNHPETELLITRVAQFLRA